MNCRYWEEVEYRCCWFVKEYLGVIWYEILGKDFYIILYYFVICYFRGILLFFFILEL